MVCCPENTGGWILDLHRYRSGHLRAIVASKENGVRNSVTLYLIVSGTGPQAMELFFNYTSWGGWLFVENASITVDGETTRVQVGQAFRDTDTEIWELASQRSNSAVVLARSISYGAQFVYMRVNQVTESVQAGQGRSIGRQSLIDHSLGLARPFWASSPREGRLTHVRALPSDLDRGQAPEGSWVIEALFVCAMCAVSRRRRGYSGISGCSPA